MMPGVKGREKQEEERRGLDKWGERGLESD